MSKPVGYRLINDDLAPTPLSQRTWNTWHVASLWVGMSVCIPTYMLSASMIQAGMSWRQSLLTIFIGNALVLLPLMANAHAGTRYGIPFPVYARASFGLRGAHIPSLARAIVACGWFGIQTWIGGLAINALLGALWPAWSSLGGDWAFMGYSLPHYLGFLLFWLLNVYFVRAGTESIKRLETLAAPFLILMGLALLAWAMNRVGDWGRFSPSRTSWSLLGLRCRPAPSCSPCSSRGSPRLSRWALSSLRRSALTSRPTS